MPTKVPPFYENFDDSHCVQCTLRGIFEYFEPEKAWTWEELEIFTDKEPGKWTWQYRAIVNAIERGYDVIEINTEDIDAYLRDGIYETMIRDIGLDAANEMQENANLVSVTDDMLKFRAYIGQGRGKHEFRVPAEQDMKYLLKKGYLLACTLNSRKLWDREGFSSHVVLVYGMDNQYIYFHDSAPTVGSDQKVTIEKFIEASTDPTPALWAITAYKLNS